MRFLVNLSLLSAALSALVSAQFGAEYNSEYASLFSDDELETIISRRVRREIRDLSSEEWNRIVDAMWVMKNTEESVGKALYGDNFRNYDHLVCQHALSGTTDGNIAHSVASFITFHRALHLEFEESLMAIDSRIEAAPYWDLRLDDDLENSVIFGDDYFGSIGGNPNEDHIVTDGKFAYWPVPLNRDQWCEGADINNFGYLRSDYTASFQAYTVRYGTHHCRNIEDWSWAASNWTDCLQTDVDGDVYQFLKCFDRTTHALAHHYVGGTWLRDNQTDSSDCLNWIWFIDETCMLDCPECDTGVDDWQNCFCSVDTSDDCSSQIVDLDIDQLFGDFDDLAHSPNDPIFFFHHINVDRLFYIWELMNLEYESDYFNYPTEGEILGVNLDDVCGYNYPFTNIWDNDHQPYTNRDIWDNTRIAINTYQYDTIVEMIIGDTDVVNHDTIHSSKLSFLSRPFNGSEIMFLVMISAVAMIILYYCAIYRRNKDFTPVDSHRQSHGSIPSYNSVYQV